MGDKTAMLADPYAQGLKLSVKGLHAQAIERFEQALAIKPDDTRTLFALGNTARALGMSRPAEEFYRRVLRLEPQRLEAVVNLANLLRAQGQFAAVVALLQPALAESPDAPELWLTLGSTYRETGDRESAALYYREALARRPNYAAALGNLAELAADEGKREEALALYDRALKADPANAQARLNRAMFDLLNGDLKRGWRDYAARFKIPGKVPVPDHSLARWNGATLKRTRLLVTAEQGVGDQIMYASMMGSSGGARFGGGRKHSTRMRTETPRAFRPFVSDHRRAALGRRDARGCRQGPLWLAQGGRRRERRHRNGNAAAHPAQPHRGFPQTGSLPRFRCGGSRPLARSLRSFAAPAYRRELAQRQHGR